MQILALDPGLTTGWCHLDTNRDAFCYGQFENWQNLEDLMTPLQVDVVVAEEFRLYPHLGDRLKWQTFPASEVIGVIKYLAERYNIPLVVQNAAQAKKLKLTEGLGMKHAEDALRHALAFLKKEGLLREPFTDLIA